MKLLNLKMNDFMAYRGEHEISFEVSEASPIILFLGENGHGKSSIQHAVRWCLYGETESKKIAIPPQQLINRKASQGNPFSANPEMSVVLTWGADGKKYELSRRWTVRNSGAQGEATLRIDGGNPVPETAIPHFVNRYLARSVAHFFFFDGEVQDEFDDMVSNAKSAAFIKNEIENLLSIPVISQGVTWLKSKEHEQYEAIAKASKEDKKVSKASQALVEAEQERSVYVSEMEQSKKKFADAEARIITMEQEMRNASEVEHLISARDQLRGEKNSLKNLRNLKIEELRNVLFSNPWIPLATKLLALQESTDSRIEASRQKEVEVAKKRNELDLLTAMQRSHRCPLCGQDKATDETVALRVQELLQDLEDQTSDDVVELTTLQHHLQQAHVNSAALTEVRNLKKEIDSFGSQIALTDQALEAKIRDLDLYGIQNAQEIVMSIRALDEDKNSAENEIKDYEKKIAECDREIAVHKSVVSRGQGVDPALRKKYQSYGYLSELLGQVKVAYAQQIKNKVQNYASQTFMSIISDPKFAGLRINENYGVDLLMQDGHIDNLKSTGQGKVSTIALVSGLIKTAMTEGFILMDTPFVSLDVGHREAVCRWAASSGLYISFFMHSGEYNEEQILQYLGGKIGRVYRIQRIDSNESTVVAEQGGF